MKLTDIKRVYVFEYRDMFKIGISNNVYNRLAQLKCGCPTITIVYASDYLKNCFYVEQILHEIFADKKIAGEWFSEVDLSLIENIVRSIGILADMEEEKKNLRKRNEKFSHQIEQALSEFAEKEMKTNKKNICVRDRIDFDNGWDFSEQDKDFLLNFFTDSVEVSERYFNGDGAGEALLIIDTIKRSGVSAAKELIQEKALDYFDSVGGEIYEYYKECKEMIDLIEKSILIK